MDKIEKETCPVCLKKTLVLTEDEMDIPYFGKTYIFAMKCNECGYGQSDVEAEEQKEPCKIEFTVKNKKDLAVRVVKSSEASVKIPQLKMSVDPGVASEGYVSNVEGLLERFKKILESERDNADDEDVRKKVDFPLSHGQVTFVKKNLNVLKSGDIFVYREKNEMGPRYPGGLPDFPKNFIYCEIEHNERKFLVINLHGFWNPAPKTDTPERLKQSEMIISFVKKYNLPVVIAGDFNLAMNTKSVGLFTEKGFRNLVKESGVKTTRSSLYTIKWRYTDPFADYIFVSDDIKLIDFKVLPDEVSDHIPLYLEFEV